MNIQTTMASSGPSGEPVEDSAAHISDTALPNIPDIEWENLDELYDMAKDYVRATKLGEFHTYRWRFERQISSDFKYLYKRLNPLFSTADNARTNIRTGAIFLRVTTLITFALYLVCLWLFLNPQGADEITNTLDLSRFGSSENLLPVIGLIGLAALTAGFRSQRLSSLRHQASGFGSSFNTNLNLLQSKANFALANISNHHPTAEGCGQRAERWAFIALWLFQLHQFYDRYVTTASWQAQTNLKWMTVVFRGIKWALLFAFIYLHGEKTEWFVQDMTSTLIAVAAVVVAALVWDVGIRRGASNNLWAENFLPAISGRSEEEIFKNHGNTKVSKVIGAIRDLQFQSANA